MAFAREMDAALEKATEKLPGVVVMAKRGSEVYQRACGFADLDTPFRMYSMTKVMTSALALLLRERHGEPSPEDEVSKFIPSFGRRWDVVEEAGAEDEAVDVHSMISGRAERVAFRRRPAARAMQVKHLMSECSGIGYELFSDLDSSVRAGALGTKRGFAIANALRQRVNPTVYTSSCILGHDLTAAEFCEVVARAGVLCTDPGVTSYGLGATVLGRVVEVVYARHYSQKPLRDIFHELLFAPLAMDSARFYDAALQGRLPALYGLRPRAGDDGDGSPDVVPAEASVPLLPRPYSNHRDHFAGPMKYDSGDTGSVMTVADYAKFLDCLLRRGTAADGSRVLPEPVVEQLLGTHFEGLSFDTGVGKMMGLSSDGAAFSTGWVTQRAGSETPKQNYWSGYAGTHVRLYADDDSYIIQGIQCMDHSGTGFLNKTFREPCLGVFLRHLSRSGGHAGDAKRQRVE